MYCCYVAIASTITAESEQRAHETTQRANAELERLRAANRRLTQQLADAQIAPRAVQIEFEDDRDTIDSSNANSPPHHNNDYNNNNNVNDGKERYYRAGRYTPVSFTIRSLEHFDNFNPTQQYSRKKPVVLSNCDAKRRQWLLDGAHLVAILNNCCNSLVNN
jgi:hypothetical protein